MRTGASTLSICLISRQIIFLFFICSVRPIKLHSSGTRYTRLSSESEGELFLVFLTRSRGYEGSVILTLYRWVK